MPYAKPKNVLDFGTERQYIIVSRCIVKEIQGVQMHMSLAKKKVKEIQGMVGAYVTFMRRCTHIRCAWAGAVTAGACCECPFRFGHMHHCLVQSPWATNTILVCCFVLPKRDRIHRWILNPESKEHPLSDAENSSTPWKQSIR